MRNLRGIVVLVLLVVLACAAGGIAAWSFWGLPDPAQSDREAIFRYLATQDVAQSPGAHQLAMVDRLEKELRGDFSLEGLSQAADSHRRTLAANAAHLKHLWFVSRTQQYHALPTGGRHAFLDERIETVLAWSNLDAAFAKPTGASGTQPSTASFFDDIERWTVEEPDPALSKQMEVVVFDGIVQWLATRELADQSQDVRRELAMRIAEQLDAGLSIAGAGDGRPDEELKRLRQNSVLLIEAWLVQQAREYADVAAAERPSYLDAQIDRVTQWGIMEFIAGNSEGVSTSSAGALAVFPQLAQQCIDRAPPEDKPKLEKMITDVQARMLMKWLQGAAGG